MSERLERVEVSTLIERYVEAAGTHGRASQDGSHEEANAAYEDVTRTYGELRKRGPEAQHQLQPLLAHPDAFVRAWVGAHALEFAPEAGCVNFRRATAVLRASTRRSHWRNGARDGCGFPDRRGHGHSDCTDQRLFRTRIPTTVVGRDGAKTVFNLPLGIDTVRPGPDLKWEVDYLLSQGYLPSPDGWSLNAP